MASRPPRLNVPNTFHHVMSRGTDQWNIFLDDRDRVKFLRLIAAVAGRYGVEVTAFCLMGNHFHLVLYCTEPNLSAAMRDLKANYARWFNQRHGRSGPLFGGPFVAKPILDDGYLITVVRYVHRNPLDLDPNINLATEQWSSHGIYLGLRPRPVWMNIRITQDLFGHRYRDIIERPQESDKVQNPIVADPGSATVQMSEAPTLALVLAAVARAADVPLAEVRPRMRNGLIGVASIVATDVAGFTAAEIAEPFGFNSASAMRKNLQRARTRLESDRELDHVLLRAIELLERAEAA